MKKFGLIKNIYPYVKPYKWLVIACLFFTLISSVISQVNAVVLQYTVDNVTEFVKNNTALSQGLDLLVFISIILLSKEILLVSINYARQFFGEKLKVYISQDLAQSVIEKMLSYKIAFFTSQGNESGKIQTRINQGVMSMTRLVQIFFIDILPLGASSVLALILMFKANVYVGLTALSMIPIYFFITYKQGNKLKGWRENMRTNRESKSHGIINILESIFVIKSFNREHIEAKKQLDLQTKITLDQMQTRKTMFLYNGLKTFIDQIGIVLIIILTTYLVIDGQMTIGAIMYHILLFNNVSAPIRQLHFIYDEVNDAIIYSDGYFEILNANQEEQTGSYKPAKIEGNFVVKNVDFTYPNGTQALKDVSLEIKKGQITALVGLSGAGKSTIINLLDKFYIPQKGQILLDGVDLTEYDTKFLRENIGLVLQKNHIFDGTIEENIRYGNQDASFEEIVEASKKAFIYDQIMQMPDKFESKATLLSGGQQQRIAIARMFIKNPPIIFLDEPTASLDAIATEQIKNSIDAIKKDRTVIIISHSLSQIIDSQMIYALEDGQVKEGGTNQECYSKDGVYRKIFEASARSLNIEKIAQTLKSN